jgi:glycosyltransferase involved in cell wall biosynthesis
MHAVKFLPPRMKPARDNAMLLDNVFWAGAAARISVCIPTWRHDVSELILALADCNAAGLAELVVLDDGGGDHEMLAHMQHVAGQAQIAVRIVACPINRGRAAARNAAIRHARAEWMLLLDADMMTDSDGFIDAYLDAVDRVGKPAVIVGGYSLKSAPKDRSFALHRWQARVSECLPAAVRSQAPGRYVFSSNVLVHRDVLKACPFDESFAGWGWEDTDWGLRAAQQFEIVHIDNPATHLGLDTDEALMRKYASSGANFARLVERHGAEAEAMPLYRMAQLMRKMPFRSAARFVAKDVARSKSFPVAVRGRALKAWRALVYAEAL